MWKCLSKYVCIFLLLTLSGVFFLFRNISILEWKLDLCIWELCSNHAEGPTPLDHNQSCNHLSQGQERTPEEALEEHYLLESIAWPEPPPRPTSIPLEQTSDPAHSHFAVLPAVGGREWHVGDQLESLVLMKDFQGHPKSHGGDFLLARLHSPELGAGVAGQVLDHQNGTYSAIFLLLWEGSVQVEVTLVHPSEAVAVLRNLREERPNRVLYKSLFKCGLLSETTMCNLCLPTNQEPLCNYTDPHTGEPWYCYKPKQLLSCDTRINHFKAGYQKDLITDKEALLFQSGVNLKTRIRAKGSDSVTVLPKKKDKPEVESSLAKPAPVRTTPSGYYFQGSWQSLGDVVMRQFNDPTAITQCLKGKVVYMYGDSTVRQYYEFLANFLPELISVIINTSIGSIIPYTHIFIALISLIIRCVVTIFVSIIPLVHFVIGAECFNDCPVMFFIPIYLIGLGCFYVVLVLLSLFMAIKDCQRFCSWVIWISLLILMFCLFAGSGVVFSVFQTTSYNPTLSDGSSNQTIANESYNHTFCSGSNNQSITNPEYCNKTLYLFAFSTSLIWILMVVLLTVGLKFYGCVRIEMILKSLGLWLLGHDPIYLCFGESTIQ
ncbi:NXPE family member 3-like isoform X1 [Oncorhynchus mykiss]|uniref:NXPE C-terminal domain-containing protein n=1 Tax=Oncorhynchus mykiss TaxID=8022 RepID=A0A8C7LXP8_ONCMY|nr:NXPE family member 3-like isoform X1 [Oncorhynchus mykiss]